MEVKGQSSSNWHLTNIYHTTSWLNDFTTADSLYYLNLPNYSYCKRSVAIDRKKRIGIIERSFIVN